MANREFKQNYTVRIADCDLNYNMTLGSCLRYAQQISTDHAYEMGISADTYKKTNSQFLIVKTAVVCHKMPVFNQEFTLITQAAFSGRVQFPRYTVLKDATTGELLVEVFSIWVLVDTNLRRILRRLPENFPDVFEIWDIPTLDLSIEKAEIAHIKTELATFLRCDENMHVNNTMYADIVCDNVPFEIMKEKQCKRFAVSYHNEIPALAEFTLQCAKENNGKFYFCANIQSTNCFEAVIEF